MDCGEDDANITVTTHFTTGEFRSHDGAYYPTETPQEAITSLHDKDPEGHDVSSVHVVH